MRSGSLRPIAASSADGLVAFPFGRLAGAGPELDVGKKRKIKTTGFPLTPMLALTFHKVQGLTFDGGCGLLDLSKSKKGGAITYEMLLVALSRFKTVDDYRILPPPHGEDLRWLLSLKPDPNTVEYLDPARWNPDRKRRFDEPAPPTAPKQRARATKRTRAEPATKGQRRPETTPSAPTVRGMRNIGNACFAIATLQCLLRGPLVPALAAAVPGTAAHAVASLAGAPSDDKLASVIRAAGYEIGSQQDADEFLGRLLAAVGAEVVPDPADLMRSRLVISTSCCGCGDSRTQEEPALVLGIPLVDFASVDALLAQALAPESVDGAPCHLCQGAEMRRETRVAWPSLLVLRVGRFRNDLAKCPSAVLLASRLSTPGPGHNYDLTGVVCHLGDAIQNGHYVAHFKSNGVWHYANDEQATPSTGPFGDEEVARNCYLLFYSRI